MSETETTTSPGWATYTAPSFVEADGLGTAYRREGGGERVVFLHGTGLTRMWLPFYAALAETCDIVVPEHPGFGDTPLPETIHSLDDLQLHYDAFLRALELDPAHIVGHGLGGWVAADLAVRYPERFKSLTLITPMGLRLADAPLIDEFRMTPAERLEALLNGRHEAFSEYLVLEGELDDTIHAMVESIAAARLAWNPRYDHRLDHRLARVRAATLVIGAQDDRMVANEMATRYAELIAGAELAIVEGPDGQPSGHLLHLEHPAATAALVARHVAAHA